MWWVPFEMCTHRTICLWMGKTSPILYVHEMVCGCLYQWVETKLYCYIIAVLQNHCINVTFRIFHLVMQHQMLFILKQTLNTSRTISLMNWQSLIYAHDILCPRICVGVCALIWCCVTETIVWIVHTYTGVQGPYGALKVLKTLEFGRSKFKALKSLNFIK